MIARRIFLLLVVTALALGAFQCVTACASDDCAPPCHAHSCVSQTVHAVLIKAPAIGIIDAAPIIAPQSQSAPIARPALAFTPPATHSAPVILRI